MDWILPVCLEYHPLSLPRDFFAPSNTFLSDSSVSFFWLTHLYLYTNRIFCLLSYKIPPIVQHIPLHIFLSLLFRSKNTHKKNLQWYWFLSLLYHLSFYPKCIPVAFHIYSSNAIALVKITSYIYIINSMLCPLPYTNFQQHRAEVWNHFLLECLPFFVSKRLYSPTFLLW